MCSCSLFLTATHFHLGGRYHFSFSQCHYKIFMFLFQQNWSPLFFISHSSSSSVIQVNVHLQTLKLSQKKELALLLLFFISISQAGYAIYCQNREVQNFTPAYMKGWMYIRTILSEIKADSHEGFCSRSMFQAHFAPVSTHEGAFSSSLNLHGSLLPNI